MKKLNLYYADMTIKIKIIILYAAITLISIFITFTVFSAVNERYTKNEVRNAGLQTVEALTGNLAFIFDNVTQFSSLIYFDDAVQQSLKSVSDQSIDPKVQTAIQKSLSNMIVSADYISSVFVFDRYYNIYSSYKMGPINPKTERIETSAWYDQMIMADGNGFFLHKSDDVLEFYSRPGQNYISYIREIRSKEDYQPMAILLVTIDAQTIEDYFDSVGREYESKFFIMDQEGNYIIEPPEYAGEYQNAVRNGVLDENGTGSLFLQGERTLLVSQPLGIQEWQLVGAFHMNTMGIMGRYYQTVILFVICLNILFIFFCSTLLTRLIFKPLSSLESHMQRIERDEFLPIPVDSRHNEINHLKRVYNHMIISIQALIQKIKEEEQIIARNELEIIHAQINPHFLYNTLDAVSALALINDSENCFKMTQALGDFYRNSLNSGLDFVSIQDEIQCIQSYMTILNIRYGGKIQTEYEIDEEIESLHIIKLVLQPVVENAVHHGINPNGGQGTINIRGFRDEQEIIFIVTDDGAGMSEERMSEVMSGKSLTGKSGFGIYSLIQRLQIYYHITNPLTIHSETGSGTEVTIRVTVMEGEF